MTPRSMPYQEWPVQGALAREVECLWTRAQGAEEHSAAVLPDGCCDLILHHGEDGPSARIVGAMTRARDVVGRPGEVWLGVRFRPGGLAGRMREPVRAFSDLSVDLEQCDRRGALARVRSTWLEQAHQLRDGVLESVVESVMKELAGQSPAAPSPLVAHAVEALRQERPPSVEQFAGWAGVSRQHLTRQVQAATGLTPRGLRRVARFRRAWDAARASRREPPWALHAATFGYVDQAHLIRDVRAFTGRTPRELWRFQTSNAADASAP